jgi:hypothetical protein
LVNRALRGEVGLGEAPGESTFRLNVPAAGFVVDDPPARREEGPDFAGEVSDDDKSSTALNMLSTAVLDAREFPVIAVNSIAVSDTQGAGALTATVAISVAGHESRIEVPFTLQVDSGRLTATGSLQLRQSALGLTPYSIMLGALQVQDAMTIKFKLVAVRA